jgi:chemotaxis protein MotB
MQWRTTWSGVVAIVALGLVASMAVGCNGQQLEERNLALQKQLDQSLKDNADLQARNATLAEQKAALAADLDKARAGTAAKPVKPKPEFGGGVTTEMVGGALHVTMPDAVLFESGKADLLTASKKVLDKVVAVLNKDYAGDRISVEGHTDNQPIRASSKAWDDNWDLASARSRAVLLYMVSKGVDPKRASAAAYAFYKPVASNATEAGRAKNRRVVIVVYPQGTP